MKFNNHITSSSTGQILAVTFCAKGRTKGAIQNLRGELSVMCSDMTKILPIIFVLFLYGCSGIEQPLEPISKDVRYTVETSKTENGIIVLIVIEKGIEIKSINTGASVYQKFAVGWLKEEAILILYSSDIGVQAWAAESSFKPETNGTKYTNYGNELYEAKYGKNT